MSEKPEFTSKDEGDKITDEPTTMTYRCSICHQLKERKLGEANEFYLKETAGVPAGRICPDCSTKQI